MNRNRSDSDQHGSLHDDSLSTMTSPSASPSDDRAAALADTERLEEERLKAYANLLDSAFRLPGGFRIGLDGIVGLVPGIGDVLGAGLSFYFIHAASRLDIPRAVITRMILNSAIETVIGLVPVVGDLFDFVFKANDRNAHLLRAALDAKDARRRRPDDR